MSSNKQTTIKVGGLGWKVSHLIVIWQCTLRRPANFHVTTSRIIIFCTDYGCPMKPFFNDIPYFWAIWTDRPNKFLGICGILGRTISPKFGTVSESFVHDFRHSVFFYKTQNIFQRRKNFGNYPSCIRNLWSFAYVLFSPAVFGLSSKVAHVCAHFRLAQDYEICFERKLWAD